MNKIGALTKKYLSLQRHKDDVPPLGTRETLCHWLSEDYDGESVGAPVIDMVRYGKLLELLPDKIVTNLENARMERAGKGAMLKAGLGYEEVLGSAIVDGAAITSSSTEAFLFPALLFTSNYLQPGGIPGRTLRLRARGRGTTLATGGTITFKVGAALTNVIPTTTWCVSGALPAHATIQTNTQWMVESDVVVRSVGAAGTVFSQGWADPAWIDPSLIANTQLQFMGSAGSAAPSTAAVDMTAPQYFSLTGKWSLTTAYSITGHIFIVEALN